MASPEYDQKPSFSEKFWKYATLGIAGVVIFFVTLEFLGAQINSIEKSPALAA